VAYSNQDEPAPAKSRNLFIFNKTRVARALPLFFRLSLSRKKGLCGMSHGLRTTLASGFPLVFLALLAWGPPAYALSPAQDDSPKKTLKADQVQKVQDPDAKTAPEGEAAEQDAGPIAVFADVEAGWKGEQVQQILRHYGKGKVAISIEGSSPTGGQFSRNQSYYLFQDLFKYTITEKFQFVQYRHVTDGRDKVYAVAERHYKRNDDGRLFKDKIYVSLHLEDDRWVISEIKSTR
jgi:hypothetical protein